jgi:hypothetical protein
MIVVPWSPLSLWEHRRLALVGTVGATRRTSPARRAADPSFVGRMLKSWSCLSHLCTSISVSSRESETPPLAAER